MEEEDEGKFPHVDHGPLNEGVVGKIQVKTILQKVTANHE